DSSLQIVDHREVNLSLTAADFIDADDMHGRPLTIPQTIAHRVLHDSCHRLPVQPVLPGGTLPAQFSGQTGDRICQRPGHPRPKVQPKDPPPPVPPRTDTSLVGADNVAASSSVASTNLAIPALSSHCAPAGMTSGILHTAAADSPGGRWKSSSALR